MLSFSLNYYKILILQYKGDIKMTVVVIWLYIK